jgi:hypothetical protein
MANLILEHPHSGIIKRAPVGFSWTTLFFPGFPALFRGDVKGFIIQFILAWLIFPIFIFPFIYNKLYIQKRLSRGFKVTSTSGISFDRAKAKLRINLPLLNSTNG